MENKDTFSRTVKEDLAKADIGSRAQAFWEACAIKKFLARRGRGQCHTLWAEPFLMRRLVQLTKQAAAPTSLTTQSSLRRRGRSGIKVPAVTHDAGKLPATGVLLRNPFLRRAYLRGCFLARGSVLSPKKGHHLEIAVGDLKDAAFIKSLLEAEGRGAGIIQRRSSFIVYMKDADDICEFLKSTGSSRAVLEYENIRVTKALKNSVQRMVNMDRANVMRSVEASLKQVEDINLIQNAIGLSKLPKALRVLAEARLENPEMSMEELGESLTPKVSKSAVNHRFRRIASIAAKLRGT